MRITVATGPMFPVPAVAGGAIPRMWLGLAQGFARRGHAVKVVARAYPGQASRDYIDGVEISRGLGFDQSRSVARNLLRGLAYALRVTTKLPIAEILVTNDFWLPALVPHLRPGAGAVVVSANRYPKGQYRLYSKVARVAAASRVVGLAVARQAPALASRVSVIPNPIDLSVFHASDEKKMSGAKVILFVGRIHPEKGVHVLIEAFRRFARSDADWCLRLIGPSDETRGGGGLAYEERLRRSAGGSAVEFVGPIFDPVQLAQRLREAMLFCYPSFAEKGEALPLAPLEAMACGVPVLTSNLDCFRDYIDPNETGFCFDHITNPIAALAARLAEVVADGGLLARVSAAGAVRAQEFGYASVAGRFVDEFENVLRERTLI